MIGAKAIHGVGSMESILSPCNLLTVNRPVLLSKLLSYPETLFLDTPCSRSGTGLRGCRERRDARITRSRIHHPPVAQRHRRRNNPRSPCLLGAHNWPPRTPRFPG